jgi:hypothetical protein
MRVKSILAFLLAITFAGSGASVGQTAAPKEDAVAGDLFKDNGDGTVTDRNTGLMWQKDDDGKQRSWDSSLTYCKNLSLGGHSDWRLPSLQNLISLWKSVGAKEQVRKKYFPSMKFSGELYPGTVAPYWSSTTGGSSAPDSAGFVSFNDGGVHIGTKEFFSFYARCVRLGK